MQVSVPKFDSVISGHNKVMLSLYLDTLHVTGTAELTYCKDADRPYYNCAHNVTDSDALYYIEAWYRKNSLPARVYTSLITPEDVFVTLRQRNFKQLPQEDENWYYFDLAQVTKFTLNTKIAIIEKNHLDIKAFVRIDSELNGIPSNLQAKLTKKLTTRSSSLVLHLAYVRNLPVATHVLAYVGDFAYMAEAATLVSYQRRGIYSDLVKKAILDAKQAKAKYLFVNCDKSAHSNQACVKLGFVPLGVRNLWERQNEYFYDRR